MMALRRFFTTEGTENTEKKNFLQGLEDKKMMIRIAN